MGVDCVGHTGDEAEFALVVFGLALCADAFGKITVVGFTKVAEYFMDFIVAHVEDLSEVFHDEDFVVLRPESVRAVIEVKSTLNSNNLKSLLENFYDFGSKWQECQEFYKHHYLSLNTA